MKKLGRKVPKDFEHVEKYPLRTALATVTIPSPVTIGVNWYTNFDNPVKGTDGRYWIGRGSLGRIRGGHCVCIPHSTTSDLYSWWDYYNQGNEGACVGFGSSRMMSLLNRKMFNPWWLWDRAKEVDGFPDTNPGDSEGTTVRAAMDILRDRGHCKKGTTTPILQEGIAANRWARDIDEVLAVLQNPLYSKLNAMPILNSWGWSYPHLVWMPLETHARLLNEFGEYTCITDR